MAGNGTPIYSRVGSVQWSQGAMTAANTTIDLTAGTSYLIFTADAANGGYIPRIRFRSLGTNVATVARVWINNGAATSTAPNNILWDEITLPATTVSQTGALTVQELPMGFALNPGYKIYVTLGTAVAAGYHGTIPGGAY